jgi:hypothetical protein
MINPAIELDFENGQIQVELISASYELQLPPDANITTLGELQRMVLGSDHRSIRLAPTSSAGNLIKVQDLGPAP